MLMLQALHYRYCILLYCNINTNFQPHSADSKCLQVARAVHVSNMHVLWKVTCITLKTAETSLAAWGFPSKRDKLIFQFHITSKINNWRSEKGVVHSCVNNNHKIDSKLSSTFARKPCVSLTHYLCHMSSPGLCHLFCNVTSCWTIASKNNV